jgi:hypothetical protein
VNPVVWKDPPPRLNRRREREFVQILRNNPGRWAVVAIAKSPSMAHWIRKTYGFEAATHKLPDGRFEVYARAPEPAREDQVVRVVGRGPELAVAPGGAP